jgi:hypothetical protein
VVKLVTDNVFRLELENGSRVLALPGSDDSVRGLTVDGWIVADEAARITTDLIAALRPMRARKPEARLAMLSTAWSRTDPFWLAWTGDDPSWIRLKATADTVITTRTFSKRSGARWAKMPFGANISACLSVPGPAPSPGICMTARRSRMCRW